MRTNFSLLIAYAESLCHQAYEACCTCHKIVAIQSCLFFRMTVVANATRLSCARLVALIAVRLPIGWAGAADVAVRCGKVKACILVVLKQKLAVQSTVQATQVTSI